MTALVILTTGVSAIVANYVSDWQKDSVRSTNGNAYIWGQKAKVINAMFTVPGRHLAKIIRVSLCLIGNRVGYTSMKSD